MDIVACLTRLGFTKQESILYVTLCREGEMTGYEASKVSGITRSNAYLALSGLVDKGAAIRVESEPVRYSAVPAEELAANMERQNRQLLDFLRQNTPSRENPRDPFYTLSGHTHIVNKMKNLIGQAKERIYISAAPGELGYVREEVEDARNRGLKIVVITSEPYHMEGITIYYSRKQPGQVRLITDSLHVLTGELSEDPRSSCLYSQNTNLVQLIKDSLTNEIRLIDKIKDV